MARTYDVYRVVWHDVDNDGLLDLELYPDGQLRQCYRETSYENDDDGTGRYVSVLHSSTRLKHRPRKGDFECLSTHASLYPGKADTRKRDFISAIPVKGVADWLALLLSVDHDPFGAEPTRFYRFAESVGYEAHELAREVGRYWADIRSNTELQLARNATGSPREP
jgi:hypothetical protein